MNNSGNFKVFKSSAGSGKTFTLTKEYLKLALVSPWLGGSFSPHYFKNILAVTFTNDAANEMRDRILNKLSDFADLKPDEKDQMLEIIFEEILNEFPQFKISIEELIDRSSQIKEILLHNYSDFSVSTIDSFNNNIVQAFKKDLKLPYNYDLELDTSEILEKATHLLLYKLGLEKEKYLNQFLIEFALKKTDEGNSWLIDEDLKSFGENVFKEEKHNIIQELSHLESKDFREIKNELSKYTKEVEDVAQQLGDKGFSLIRQNSIPDSALFRGKTGIYGYFKKLSSLDRPLAEIAPNSFVLKTIEEDKWYSTKATSAQKSSIDQITESLKDLFHQIQQFLQKHLSDYIVAYSLRKNIFLLGTIKEFEQEVSGIKEEKNIIHISDFNKKINQIVENEPVPYIYERIGEKYKHILIDEFQDTSQMQWHNLIPLITNALGEGMASMIVGDAKQAIYRWRGGKSEMLVNLPEIPTAAADSVIAQDSYIFHQEFNPQNLETNYRSNQNIIQFNNTFFESTSKLLNVSFNNIGEFYQEVAQKHTNKKGGHVSFSFTYSEREEYQKFNISRILEIIEETLENGYQKSDIAILVRENRNGAFIAEQLLAYNIPVISAESLLLVNSWCVRFILDFIKIINNPYQPTLKMELLNFIDNELKERHQQLSIGKTKDSSTENNLINNYLDFQEIASNSSLEVFLTYIKKQYNFELDIVALQLLSIYELTEEIVRVFGLGKHLDQQVYIQKLLDELLRFGQRNGNNIDEFLDYWDHKKDKLSINTPKSGDAVKIISIHKSKGLQFPVVIMPFADWKTTPNTKATLWKPWQNDHLASKLPAVILGVNKQLQKTSYSDDYLEELEATFIESYNILYVAFTRAEEKLYVISKEAKKAKDNEIKNVSMLFHTYINRETSENITIEDKTINFEDETFEYTEAILHQDKQTKINNEVQIAKSELYLAEFIHTEPSLKVRMRRDDTQSLENLLSINEVLSARKKGLLIHHAFEKIKYREDIPKAMRKIVNEGLLSEEEANIQKEMMEKITALPEIKRYYQNGIGIKVKNERDLLLNENDDTGTLRPDRMVFDGDEVVIIDYKSGVEDTPKHQNQLDKYEHSLKKIGYSQVKKIIVYTELVKAVVL